MKVQECGGELTLVELGADPQADMIRRCRRFQERVGAWDDSVSMRTANVVRTLHHLDMGIQELSEAWDLLEGGWKHHKRNPDPPDADEILMELVDVAHFMYNAYLYMGGEAEQEVVAGLVARSNTQLHLPRIGMSEAWQLGDSSVKRDRNKIDKLYGHGSGAHGVDWEKESATLVNAFRAKMFSVTETIRGGLENLTPVQVKNFPASSGFVYIELAPWLFACAASIPGCTEQVFYSAFVKKSDINFARQDRGY